MSLKNSLSLRLSLLSILGGILLVFMFASRAFAISPPSQLFINVSSQTQTVNFPKGIDFQLRVSDRLSPITRAVIEIQYDSYGAQRHNVAITSPAQTITLHWHEQLEGNQLAIPGLPISYKWHLTDTLGNKYTTNIEAFTLNDDRFAWQTVSRGLLDLHWYNQPSSFGQELLKQASQDLERISADLGGSLNERISLWIYQDENDYKSALGKRANFSVGMAYPTFNQAFFFVKDLNDPAVQGTLPHELTHIILYQVTGKHTGYPVWFNEGMAIYHEDTPNVGLQSSFSQALADHKLLRLDEFDDEYPKNDEQNSIAYAQSLDLITYMYKTFGQQKMQNLLRSIADTSTDFNQDLTQSLGIDTVRLEQQWRLSHNLPPIS